MTTLTDKHIAWLGKFAERVAERNSQLRFKPESDEQWAGVAFSVVEGMFTAPLETPPEGLPELSALDAEIERVISEMAEHAPDVESGDESAADVKAYWHGLFARYAAAKLAERDAAIVPLVLDAHDHSAGLYVPSFNQAHARELLYAKLLSVLSFVPTSAGPQPKSEVTPTLAAKLADMTAQRDAVCQARDAATKAYREGIAAAEQVTRRMELERNAAVRNCAITQSRYDVLRLESERKDLELCVSAPLSGTEVRAALIVLEENTKAELQDMLWSRDDLLMAHRKEGGESGCDYGPMSRNKIREQIAKLRLLRKRSKQPTLPEIEHAAREARDAALKKIRDDFQERAAHYTPPRGADVAAWKAWIVRNAMVHGEADCPRRFPEHAKILLRLPLAMISQDDVIRLENASYRRKA